MVDAAILRQRRNLPRFYSICGTIACFFSGIEKTGEQINARPRLASIRTLTIQNNENGILHRTQRSW